MYKFFSYQDALSRKAKPEDNIMVTTHLICPAPEGPKYEASVKWGVPVVSKDWLLNCVTCKHRLPEDEFPIVDNSKIIILTVLNFSIVFQLLTISYFYQLKNHC